MLWGFSGAPCVPPGKISPCTGIQTSTLEERGMSASEAVGWFYLDNAGTRTDSWTLQARALYLVCSACRRATPLDTLSNCLCLLLVHPPLSLCLFRWQNSRSCVPGQASPSSPAQVAPCLFDSQFAEKCLLQVDTPAGHSSVISLTPSSFCCCTP